MPRFAIRHPHVIIVACLMIGVFGITSLARMPVDMFPAIKIPVVVVATFYSGMPPEQIETDITGRFERFFTLGSGIEHIESRSLPGVSLIKIFFQPGTSADAAVTMISNLAMANLRRLPPGTLPPVVLKFDASSLPVCLVTLKGEGMSETELRDTGQYAVRNQVAGVAGASIPPPFGGKYRQIMIYVDPLKLQAYQLSPMDVVRAVNTSNLILPAGDVKIGDFDYVITTNSQLDDIASINSLPIKTRGTAAVRISDLGQATDGHQVQANIVRVDGQDSVYLPILKQGGDTNTIAVVNGIRRALTALVDVPKQLVTRVVFDQSKFVRHAIEALVVAGAIGLALTGLLVLLFLGSMRATLVVLLSVPLSVLAAFFGLWLGGSSLNSMVLGGLALAFSRLISNAVVVLESIVRHLEMNEPPEVAAQMGSDEVAPPVLASTLASAVVFFPVLFLYGVSKFLFTALALALILALAASYIVALTVVPVFCAKMMGGKGAAGVGQGLTHPPSPDTEPDAYIAFAVAEELERLRPLTLGERYQRLFNRWFGWGLAVYGRLLAASLRAPATLLVGALCMFVLSLSLFPRLGVAFFPRSEAGQFVINVKAASGTRIEVMEQEVRRVEDLIRRVVAPDDLGTIVSNIGVAPGFSSIYTSNSAPHTAFVQVSMHLSHAVSSQEYMRRMRRRLAAEFPGLSCYVQSGGLVDAVLNLGLPAPIDVQVSGSDLEAEAQVARTIADKIRRLPEVSDVFTPQDLDYPTLRLSVDRFHSRQQGLSQREVVQNVITALTSNQMIAPSYWVDPKTGNDYMLTVQYPEDQVKSLLDLGGIPLHGPDRLKATTLDAVSRTGRTVSPTEVDHYQIQRVIDVYVGTAGEDLGRVATEIEGIVAQVPRPAGVRVTLRGMVEGMRASFKSFAIGLIVAALLVYLILVAQLESFVDPWIILLSVPLGLTGVLVTLYAAGATLNVQSLMGVVMMVGIVVSNSILLVELIARLRAGEMSTREAVETACRIRLRPIIITSLATIVGLLPLAIQLRPGCEIYAPLALAIIGGLAVSGVLSIFVVPAAYLVVHGGSRSRSPVPATF